MIDIIILGIIQGIAEFLPISSSAHLIIFRDLFGIGRDLVYGLELTFDIALHFGTLLALIIYFFKDFIKIIKDGFTKKGKLLWYIVLATIPAGVVGILFNNIIENFFRRQIWLIAIALIVMGIIIYLVDKNSEMKKDINKITLKDALIIGISQILALIPGFSRSGTTITAGRALKLNREDAAKFSFFLSAPIVLGGTLFTLLDSETITSISENIFTFSLGVGISFIVGLFCISFLLRYIRKHDFKLFMWYRIVLGLIVLLYMFIK